MKGKDAKNKLKGSVKIYIYISVETWVHDVLKYVDDRGDQRKTPKRRIIEPFGIAEVIGCFVVQVWMARVLGETKKRNEGI